LEANATEPANITEIIVFDEHVAGEFIPSASGVVVDFDSVTSPYHGAKCASVGAIGNNDTITFTAAAAKLKADYESLSLFLKLKSVATSKHMLYVQFRLAGVAVSNEVALQFNFSDINNWQNISLLLSAFTFSNAQFDSLRLRWSKTGTQTDFTGFYLDYIKLQKGVVQPTFVDSIELTGDVTGQGKTGTPFETTMKTVNSTVGAFGSATKSVTITVDAKGRITSVSENTIEGSGGITDAPANGNKYARKDNAWIIVLDGTNGKSVELSTSGGYFVWRLVGDPDWIQLYPVPLDGDDGRSSEMSVQGGYVCWRLVGDVTWNQLYQIPAAGIADAPSDGKLYGRKNGAWAEVVIPSDNSVIVRIDFQSLEAFDYTCPVALKFTSQTNESTAANLSVALNTNMAQFQNLTVTPTALGLVILEGVQL
jgi:hypothetical protein